MAPDKSKIHYWDLHPQLCVGFRKSSPILPWPGCETISIRKLCTIYGKSKNIEKEIAYVYNWRRKEYRFRISLPLDLENKWYVMLYSLLLSEGTYKNDFRLHVPEEGFHNLFVTCLSNLFGKQISPLLNVGILKGVKRTRPPAVLRYFLPVPEHIPKFILKNKEFAKRYLRVAFEAEGSPVLNLKEHKRCVSLTRNTDVSSVIRQHISSDCVGERIYVNALKDGYPQIFRRLLDCPPLTLVGENLMLKYCFGIHSSMKFECIRVNKTSFRRGKFSAKWRLSIYADSLDKFINEVGFLFERKRKICQEMKQVKGRRRKFFALEVMKKLARNEMFRYADYVEKMRKFGYVTPQKYLWYYNKKGLIKRIKEGVYSINI